MKGKPTKKLHTEERLKAHKKGKEYVAQELARQEKMHEYPQLDASKIPSNLDYFGKQQWKVIIPLLNQLPIAEHDRNLVESWCILYSQRRKLQRELDKNGEIITTYNDEGEIKNVRKNPAFDMLLATVKEMRMIANQLGLTVSSRLSMIEPEEEEAEDEFLKLIKGG